MIIIEENANIIITIIIMNDITELTQIMAR